jgi:hypothetical protein
MTVMRFHLLFGSPAEMGPQNLSRIMCGRMVSSQKRGRTDVSRPTLDLKPLPAHGLTAACSTTNRYYCSKGKQTVREKAGIQNGPLEAQRKNTTIRTQSFQDL